MSGASGIFTTAECQLTHTISLGFLRGLSNTTTVLGTSGPIEHNEPAAQHCPHQCTPAHPYTALVQSLIGASLAITLHVSDTSVPIQHSRSIPTGHLTCHWMFEQRLVRSIIALRCEDLSPHSHLCSFDSRCSGVLYSLKHDETAAERTRMNCAMHGHWKGCFRKKIGDCEGSECVEHVH